MLLKIKSGEIKIGLIGLGYVGLPLAVEFGRKYDTVGFDVKPERLEALLCAVESFFVSPAAFCHSEKDSREFQF